MYDHVNIWLYLQYLLPTQYLTKTRYIYTLYVAAGLVTGVVAVCAAITPQGSWDAPGAEEQGTYP